MQTRFATITLAPAIDIAASLDSSIVETDVCRVVSEEAEPGGKGLNVAKTLARLGAATNAGGFLGKDNAAPFEHLMQRSGIADRFVRVPGVTRSNFMFTGSDGTERKVNFKAFPGLEPDESALDRVIAAVAEDSEVVVISGSLPAKFPPETAAFLVDRLHAMSRTVVLDMSGDALRAAAARHPAVIKPNRKEAAELLGRSLESSADIAGACRELAANHECVIVSDGGGGAYFASAGAVWLARAPKVRVLDTTSAGDTLLAAFCFKWFPSKVLTHEAMALAVAAGAAAVELPASRTPDVARIETLAGQVRTERLF